MRIDTLPITTMDGLTLQADLALPDAVAGAVVVCHPHPQFGGDRYNHVVDALFRALPAAGFATLRFDFRGVNDSEGQHGGGIDERMDALAAVEMLEPFCGDGPLVMAGYSFGALVALDTPYPALAGWAAVAPPLGMRPDTPLAATDPRPKLLLVPAHDQFSPPPLVTERSAGWTSTTVEVVESADHFLVGSTGAVAARVVEFVRSLAAR